MVRNTKTDVPDARHAAVLRVLEEVIARRMAGDPLPDDRVTAAHADLLPELGEKLRALHLAERARSLAEGAGTDGDGSSRAREPAFDPLAAPAIPGYEVGEPVGRGANGAVYRAVQVATRREVAIKVMLPALGWYDRGRFELEARALAQLKHPGIVTIYDTGWTAGHFFLVMDYVAGRPLHEFARRAAPAVPQKLELFSQICDAVHAAHLRGVIHRDLKPANILVDEAGLPHLLDFGLAKLAAQDGDATVLASGMTMTGQFIGSLPWASPEQAEGAADKIDVRTDVYSLGVILYQLLADRFPYSVLGNIRDVIDRILTAEPRPPSELSRGVDHELDTIVLKCLAKDRPRRYQGAGELAADVRRYLRGEPIEAKRDSAWYMLRKTVRRYRLPLALAAAAALLCVGSAASMYVLYGRARHEADRAQRTLAFLQDTLFQASSHRLGSDATLVEVLDHVALHVGEQFQQEPAMEAPLRYTIGSAYETIWRKEEAATHLRRSLDLYREAYGEDHPETLRCMVLLGMVLAELGQPEAVELQRTALETRLRQHGEQHRLVADSRNEYAFALWAAAKPAQWEESERHYVAALNLYQQTLGAEHGDIARSLTGFAAMRLAQGQAAEAEKLYLRALDMARKLFGQDHQFVVECMGGYADTLQALGRYGEAEVVLRSVLEHAPRLFGRASLSRMHRALAAAQRGMQDWVAAEQTLRTAAATACESLLPKHPAESAPLSALVQRLRGGFADGEPAGQFHELLLAAESLGMRPAESARNLCAYAELLMDRGEIAPAEPLLRSAVELLERAPLRGGAFQARARRLLSRCLAERGLAAEATELLRQAHAVLCRTVGEAHPQTERVMRELSVLEAS
ncbi:MAG: serine/threonine protein kinase [Planctomycetes bacterium]|nr:serine/threonine protein kinase [Planctomycetota bacterium]